jgi:hypothetical protein
MDLAENRDDVCSGTASLVERPSVYCPLGSIMTRHYSLS